jgi:hypothetical protein
MTQTVDYDIVGSFNNQRVTEIDAERSVNLFEYIDALGKKPKSLINTSGLTNTLATFPSAGNTDPFRAQFVFNGVEYDVIGNHVYTRTISGLVTLIGTINTAAGYVGIDANTFQVIFVDGQNGWIWDTKTNLFKQITDPAFPQFPIDVCFLDGFFIVASGGTNNFNLSSINQGFIWGADNTGVQSTFTMGAGASNIVITYASGFSIANYQVGSTVSFNGAGIPAELKPAGTSFFVKSIVNPTTITVSATDGGAAIVSVAGGNGNITNSGALQQGSITTHPGNIVACRTLHRKLFLFSQFFTEVWENQGIGVNLPFRRNNSLLMEYGTPALGSIAVGFDKMFFISQDRDGQGSVMEVIGSESTPVSNRALDFILAQYASVQQISDCRSFLIKENGIIFYRMNFTLANHTYVYNVTFSDPARDETKFWHEEEVLNGDRHLAQTHSFFNGINYVGSYKAPILYQIDPNTFTNDNETIRRMRITKAFVPPGYQRIRIDRLQVDLLQGQVDLSDSQLFDIDLLTESGSNIDTESNLDIILEQGLNLVFPNPLLVYMSISKDGGQTYGYKVTAPMGNVGQRTFRTVWRKLGTTKRGQAFVAKFEFFEEAPFVILGASWAMEVLPE